MWERLSCSDSSSRTVSRLLLRPLLLPQHSLSSLARAQTHPPLLSHLVLLRPPPLPLLLQLRLQTRPHLSSVLLLLHLALAPDRLQFSGKVRLNPVLLRSDQQHLRFRPLPPRLLHSEPNPVLPLFSVSKPMLRRRLGQLLPPQDKEVSSLEALVVLEHQRPATVCLTLVEDQQLLLPVQPCPR